jgi:hypothetical protein
MADTLPCHSILATDRPIYHDGTRRPDGNSIMLKDRRQGDGGRDSCEHCAQYLSHSLETLGPLRRLGGVLAEPPPCARGPSAYSTARATGGR